MSRFTAAIERNWRDYLIFPGASPNCRRCGDIGKDDEEAIQLANEGSFSWSACGSCNSGLGGDRYASHAIHKQAFGPDAQRPGDVHHIEICVDCLMFHANGDEPENWEG